MVHLFALLWTPTAIWPIYLGEKQTIGCEVDSGTHLIPAFVIPRRARPGLAGLPRQSLKGVAKSQFSRKGSEYQKWRAPTLALLSEFTAPTLWCGKASQSGRPNSGTHLLPAFHRVLQNTIRQVHMEWHFPLQGYLAHKIQGYLAHKKTPPTRTLQWAYAEGPMVVLWGGALSYEQGIPVGCNRMQYGRVMRNAIFDPDLRITNYGFRFGV